MVINDHGRLSFFASSPEPRSPISSHRFFNSVSLMPAVPLPPSTAVPRLTLARSPRVGPNPQPTITTKDSAPAPTSPTTKDITITTTPAPNPNPNSNPTINEGSPKPAMGNVQTPVSAATEGTSVTAPVTAEIVKEDVSVAPVVEAPETKKSPAAKLSSSFVLPSLDDDSAGDAIDKDEQIQQLMREVERLRKTNAKLLSSMPETTDKDTRSWEQCVLDGFKSMLTVDKVGKRTKYTFHFKNSALAKYLFEGCGEGKKKIRPPRDTLSEEEQKLLDFYLDYMKIGGAKVQFCRTDGSNNLIKDFLSRLESDKQDKAKDLVDGDEESMFKVLFAILAACCRRLFAVSYNLNTSSYGVTMGPAKTVKRFNELTVIKALFFERECPTFVQLTPEQRLKFMLGKGILYSTIFYMPDDFQIEDCIRALFDMLDVLAVLFGIDID